MLGNTSVAAVAGCPPVMNRTLFCSWEVGEASNGTPGFEEFSCWSDIMNPTPRTVFLLVGG